MDKIQFTVIESNEDTLDPLNLKIKKESNVNSETFFGSLKPTNESKIKKQIISVKTSNLDLGKNKNTEVIEFLESNGLGYIIPITIAGLIGIVVTWMRLTSDRQDKQEKHTSF